MTWHDSPYETVREMMAAAVDEHDARPGMIDVIQTFASSLKWNPHVHTIASRGVWTPGGEWIPVAYVDEHRAELLFRHKLLALLRDRDHGWGRVRHLVGPKTSPHLEPSDTSRVN